MPCPRVLRCKLSCPHRQLVESYWQAREVWERQAELEAIGYATELAEYAQTNPPPLFKHWLIATRGRRDHYERSDAAA